MDKNESLAGGKGGKQDNLCCWVLCRKNARRTSRKVTSIQGKHQKQDFEEGGLGPASVYLVSTWTTVVHVDDKEIYVITILAQYR